MYLRSSFDDHRRCSGEPGTVCCSASSSQLLGRSRLRTLVGRRQLEALTVDGRWVDPFSIDAMRTDELQPPNFDLLNAKSFGYNQIWSDYYNRMHMAGNTRFRKPMKDYIFRLQDRTGNPNDAIVKGAVYWVHDNNPRMNSTKSYGYSRKKLFSFTNPDRDVQKRFRKAGGHTPPPVPAPWGPTEK